LRSDEHATKNAQDEEEASPRAKSEETRAQRVNPSREHARRTGCAEHAANERAANERAANERAANERAAPARAAYASRVLGVNPSLEHAAKNTPCCSELAALNPSRRTHCERTSKRAHAALNPRLEHAAQNRLRRTRSASRKRGDETRACLKPSLVALPSSAFCSHAPPPVRVIKKYGVHPLQIQKEADTKMLDDGKKTVSSE